MKKYIVIISALSVSCIILAVMLLVRPDLESVTGYPRTESYVNGVLYQKSAEVSAQYKQAFELARIRLDEAIEENSGTGKGLHIVTDIDATLMDDSAYFAGVLLSGAERKKKGLSSWDNNDWQGFYSAAATEAVQPVSGAQEFVSYAVSKGVKIHFITNRPYYELDLTVKQLKKYGFIDDKTAQAYSGLDDLQEYHSADESEALAAFRDKVIQDGRFELGDGYFTLKNDYTIQVQGLEFSGDKSERRHNVSKSIGDDEKIILYLGDSLNDMVSGNEWEYTDLSENESASFSSKNGNTARKEAIMNELWKDKWGTVFIVMPNSAYGDWVAAAWYRQKTSDSERIEAIQDWLLENSYLNSDIWYEGPSPIGSNIE